MPFFQNPNFYYISLILQAICVLHCLKKGNQNKWIWLIVFLPYIGCIAYLFSEILTKNEINRVGSGLGDILRPGNTITRLENELKFADTFTNRMQLADAYLKAGYTDKAIELYESCLSGPFNENEQVYMQLMNAYFAKQQYNKILAITGKVYHLPEFLRSRNHMIYALALELAGQTEAAEKELLMMVGKFSFFEQRYNYGLFLIRNDREEEAINTFREMIREEAHLSNFERRHNRIWINKAKDQLRNIRLTVPK